MKITVSKKAISAALQHCCAAATRNSTMPILKCVKLVPMPDGFELSAANEGRRMAVTCRITAQVSQPEALCVSAHDLFDRVKALPDGDIKLVAKSGKLSLESGNRKLTLSYVGAEDYPLIPEQPAGALMLSSQMLSASLKATLFAVCEDSSRQAMHGVRWLLGGGKFRADAADGKRIASYSVDSADGSLLAVIPQASALVLRSVLEGAMTEAAVNRDDTTLFLTLGDVSFCALTIGYDFPPVDRFLEEPAKNECKVMTQVAVDSLKAMQAVSGKLGQVTIEKTKGNIRIVSVSDGGDESTDEFMAEGGEDFPATKFNAPWLIDAIVATGEETCTLDATEPLEPIRIRGGLCKHLVMPIMP